MAKLKVAIIGVGSISEYHIEGYLENEVVEELTEKAKMLFAISTRKPSKRRAKSTV